jgi:hypothetical protein
MLHRGLKFVLQQHQHDLQGGLVLAEVLGELALVEVQVSQLSTLVDG